MDIKDIEICRQDAIKNRDLLIIKGLKDSERYKELQNDIFIFNLILGNGKKSAI